MIYIATRYIEGSTSKKSNLTIFLGLSHYADYACRGISKGRYPKPTIAFFSQRETVFIDENT